MVGRIPYTIESVFGSASPWHGTLFGAGPGKIDRMIRPEELQKHEPLTWSTGTGADVWEMFCAAMAGDMPSLQRLLDKDPSLVRCQHGYLGPLYFAVRENQVGAAAY